MLLRVLRQMQRLQEEVRSTKPAWSETFRDAWRFADRTGRKTDDTGLTRTETVAKRKCSGRIAKCAARDPAESERSKAIGDSGPTRITREPDGRKSDAKANR